MLDCPLFPVMDEEDKLKEKFNTMSKEGSFTIYDDEYYVKIAAPVYGVQELIKNRFELFDQYLENLNMLSEIREVKEWQIAAQYYQNNRCSDINRIVPTEITEYFQRTKMLSNIEFFEKLSSSRDEMERIIHLLGMKVFRNVRKKSIIHKIIYFIRIFESENFSMNSIQNSEMKEKPPNQIIFETGTEFENKKQFDIKFSEKQDNTKISYQLLKNLCNSGQRTFECKSCGAKLQVKKSPNEKWIVTICEPHKNECKGGAPFITKSHIEYVAEYLLNRGQLTFGNLRMSFRSPVNSDRLSAAVRNLSDPTHHGWFKLNDFLDRVEEVGGNAYCDIDPEFHALGFITNIAITFLKSDSFMGILFIDGQFSNCAKNGKYITLCTVSPQNEIIPLACGFGIGEGKSTLKSVFCPLLETCPHLNSPKVTIFSDGGTGIISAIIKYLPNANRKRCAWHLTLKFYSNVELKALFWEYVKSANDEERNLLIKQMKENHPTEYTNYIEPHLNEIVKFEKDQTYGFSSNSLCESCHSMFKNVKHCDPLKYFECFVFKTFEIFENINESLQNEKNIYLNYIMNSIEYSKAKASAENVLKILSEYDEHSKIFRIYDSVDKKEYQVNCIFGDCTCNRTYRGYPCSHLFLVMKKTKHDFEMIDDVFRTEKLRKFCEEGRKCSIVDTTNLREVTYALPEFEKGNKSKIRKKSAGVV